MYDKFDVFMKQSVRDEVEYIRAGIEAAGLDYLESNVKRDQCYKDHSYRQ